MLNLTIIRIDDGSLEALSGFFRAQSDFGCFMLNIILHKKIKKLSFYILKKLIIECMYAHFNLSVIIVKALLHIFLINGQNGGSEVVCRVS